LTPKINTCQKFITLRGAGVENWYFHFWSGDFDLVAREMKLATSPIDSKEEYIYGLSEQFLNVAHISCCNF
jgi:hypothetical protein